MFIHVILRSAVALLMIGSASLASAQILQPAASDDARTTVGITRTPVVSPPFTNVIQPNMPPQQGAAPPFANIVQPNAPIVQPTAEPEIESREAVMPLEAEVEAVIAPERSGEFAPRGPQSLVISSQTGTTGTIRISDTGEKAQPSRAPASAPTRIKYSEVESPSSDQNAKRYSR